MQTNIHTLLSCYGLYQLLQLQNERCKIYNFARYNKNMLQLGDTYLVDKTLPFLNSWLSGKEVYTMSSPAIFGEVWCMLYTILTVPLSLTATLTQSMTGKVTNNYVIKFFFQENSNIPSRTQQLNYKLKIFQKFFWYAQCPYTHQKYGNIWLAQTFGRLLLIHE